MALWFSLRQRKWFIYFHKKGDQGSLHGFASFNKESCMYWEKNAAVMSLLSLWGVEWHTICIHHTRRPSRVLVVATLLLETLHIVINYHNLTLIFFCQHLLFLKARRCHDKQVGLSRTERPLLMSFWHHCWCHRGVIIDVTVLKMSDFSVSYNGWIPAALASLWPRNGFSFVWVFFQFVVNAGNID